jgi:hypothetical protein
LNSVGSLCESCCISLKNCPGVEIDEDAAPPTALEVLEVLEVLDVLDVLDVLLVAVSGSRSAIELEVLLPKRLLTFMVSSPGVTVPSHANDGPRRNCLRRGYGHIYFADMDIFTHRIRDPKALW